jgi:hypothetical protein
LEGPRANLDVLKKKMTTWSNNLLAFLGILYSSLVQPIAWSLYQLSYLGSNADIILEGNVNNVKYVPNPSTVNMLFDSQTARM